MELDPSANIALPPADKRAPIPEPLPVRLIAIEDVHLPAPAGKEVELDEFYVGMWEFERDDRHLVCGVHPSQTESAYEVAIRR